MTLYISDLDGTLLNSHARLSDYSRTSLRMMIHDGCLFTVASARSVMSMQIIFDGLELKLPVIEFNGACISNLATGEHLHINSCDWDVADSIIEAAEMLKLVPFYSTISNGKDHLFPAEIGNEGMAWYVKDRIEHSDPRLQRSGWSSGLQTSHDLICLTFIDTEERLSELEKSLGEDSRLLQEIALNRFENHYSPGWHWLTVHDRRAKKHIAAEQVRSQFAAAAHELVVFGDNLNDLSMFASADRSYAVANAAGPILEAATAVIGSNDEDSVVREMQKELGYSEAERTE